ncbi:MAG: VWA domain-containing protein [Geminicoccaceae bacterium]
MSMWLLRLLVLLPLVLTSPLRAEDARTTLIVMDASGSMAAKIGGATRMDIAKGVLRDLVAKWGDEAPLGLMAYGHRRKSDCADIELLAAPAPSNAKALLAAVKKLQPKGKTPLGASLEQAARALQGTGGPATVVLVTDGIENCASDPCAIAKELKAAHADLVIQVIGFATEESARKQLQCIAEAGGGELHTAATAAELATAVTVAATAPPPPAPAPAPEPAPPPPPAPKTALVGFTARLGQNGPEVEDALSWRVERLDGNEPGKEAYAGGGAGFATTLDAGRYRVTGKAANVTATMEVTVAGGQDEKHVLVLDAGRAALQAIPSAGGDPLRGQGEVAWTVEPKQGQEPPAATPDPVPTLLLAAGPYAVTARSGPLRATAPLDVKAGAETTTIVDLHAGTLHLEAALAEDGPPITDWRDASWRLTALDATGYTPDEPVTELDGPAPAVLLSAGRYRATARLAGVEVAKDAEIKEGEETTARIVVPASTVTFTAALAPGAEPYTDWRDASWTVESVDALGVPPGTKTADALASAAPELKLTPGRWKVAVTSGVATALREIDVKADTTVTERLDLNAGRVTADAHPAEGIERSVNTVYAFRPLAADGTPGEPLYSGGSSESLSIILPAGRYQVEAVDHENRTASAVLDLAPGASPTVDLLLK